MFLKLFSDNWRQKAKHQILPMSPLPDVAHLHNKLFLLKKLFDRDDKQHDQWKIPTEQVFLYLYLFPNNKYLWKN